MLTWDDFSFFCHRHQMIRRKKMNWEWRTWKNNKSGWSVTIHVPSEIELRTACRFTTASPSFLPFRNWRSLVRGSTVRSKCSHQIWFEENERGNSKKKTIFLDCIDFKNLSHFVVERVICCWWLLPRISPTRTLYSENWNPNLRTRFGFSLSLSPLWWIGKVVWVDLCV